MTAWRPIGTFPRPASEEAFGDRVLLKDRYGHIVAARWDCDEWWGDDDRPLDGKFEPVSWCAIPE